MVHAAHGGCLPGHQQAPGVVSPAVPAGGPEPGLDPRRHARAQSLRHGDLAADARRARTGTTFASSAPSTAATTTSPSPGWGRSRPGSGATCRSRRPTARRSRPSTSRTRAWSAAGCCRARSSSRRPSVNVLLPAWLQFMVHDWLSHGRNVKENPHRFPVPAGDDWNRPEMTILRTRPDPSAGPAGRGRPGHLPQRVHPLVGRLADLRLRPQAAVPRPQRPGPASLHGGWRRRAARPLGAAARRQALARRAGAAAARHPSAGHRPHPGIRAGERQLVGRPLGACTRSSPASTTRSSTGCGSSTRTRTASGCSRRRG